MKKIELPDRNKDIVEEAFRLGWESAITLKDMIDAQSEDAAIDNLRGIAYALYFEALHEKTIKNEVTLKRKRATPDPYPCNGCEESDPSSWVACRGCDKEREWMKKWGNKND